MSTEALTKAQELCQCPICGRLHQHLANDPPASANEAFAYILKTSDDHGVCIGGRFNGWLMWLHPDGQWVSVRKLGRAALATKENTRE